jgi:molybdenum cofactor synthesis domain-containing protein
MNEPEIKILSVNISTAKGTGKTPRQSIQIVADGVEGDSHRGSRNREVSLLGIESIEDFNTAESRSQSPGNFAENITTAGFPIYKLNPLDVLDAGDVILEVTQIGKKCHGSSCGILRETGKCIVPAEGIFARVIKSGTLTTDHHFRIQPKVLQVTVVTASDRASRGEYEDRSGPAVQGVLETVVATFGYPLQCTRIIVPDGIEQIQNVVLAADADIIIVTGGTGIGPNDFTPEALIPLLDKQIPGIMEMARVKFGTTNPNALLSRSVAGVRGTTAIYGIPGSPAGATEYMELIAPTLKHTLHMLHGLDGH